MCPYLATTSGPNFGEVFDDFMIAVAKSRANRPGRHAALVFGNINVVARDPAMLQCRVRTSEKQ